MAQKAAEPRGCGGGQKMRPYGWTDRDPPLGTWEAKDVPFAGDGAPLKQEIIRFAFWEHFSG